MGRQDETKDNVVVEEVEANSWDSDECDVIQGNLTDNYVVYKPEEVADSKEQHNLDKSIDGQDETKDNVVVEEVEANSWDSDESDVIQGNPTDNYVVYKPEEVADSKEQNDLDKSMDGKDETKDNVVKEVEANSWDSDECDVIHVNPTDNYVVYKPEEVTDSREQHNLVKSMDGRDETKDNVVVKEVEANSWDSDESDVIQGNPTDNYVVYKPEEVTDSREQHNLVKSMDGRDETKDNVVVKEVEANSWDSDECDVIQGNPTDNYVVYEPENIADSKEQQDLDKSVDGQDETEDNVVVEEVEEQSSWHSDDGDVIHENRTHDQKKTAGQNKSRDDVKVEEVGELEQHSWDSEEGNVEQENQTDKYIVFKPDERDENVDTKAQYDLDKTTDAEDETRCNSKVEINEKIGEN
ncbi:hypothetical protein LOTGIDRAFT_176998, partial [Lottia gigantea]